MSRHKSITVARIVAMVKRDQLEGICGACGQDAANVEPDARKVRCEHCGEHRVYGAEEWLMMTEGQ